jgi:diaminohydroxyphosphoribosylaminopyrimidine deaminase / 5-amino-6-(5-phosphoribosylamino)uracil reductase
MRRALALASRGAGETNPNPLVGCVVVRQGRAVGEGFHARAGQPHAEVMALSQAGARARGATLYVNLEPCAHQGRTPPCAPAVAESGVRRVVLGMRDPNPLVDGRGAAVLRRAGLEVTAGMLADECRHLNRRFAVGARGARPFVLLKVAVTLDGRVATACGDAKWITSVAQRRSARGLRRLQDGVAVGVGTVLADDPLLLPRPRTRRPFTRVVFDSRLRTPPESRLVRSASARTPVVLLCTTAGRRRAALERRGVTVVQAPPGVGGVDVGWAVAELRRRGVWSLMVEGGSELLGSFLAARLLDELVVFRAPLLLGGRGSRPAFGGEDPLRVSEALVMRPGMPDALLPGLSAHAETWVPCRPRGATRAPAAG